MSKGIGKIQQIVKELVQKIPVQQEWTASEFISVYWNSYIKTYESNASVNGGVFEQLLVLSLLREGIYPVYTQARLAFVPNVR